MRILSSDLEWCRIFGGPDEDEDELDQTKDQRLFGIRIFHFSLFSSA